MKLLKKKRKTTDDDEDEAVYQTPDTGQHDLEADRTEFGLFIVVRDRRRIIISGILIVIIQIHATP